MKFIIHQELEATLRGEIHGGDLFLHLDLHISKMTVTDYKLLLLAWSKAKETIKGMGWNKVNVLIPDDDKLVKFESMFGFKVLGCYTGKRGKVYVHMVQELE